MTFSDILDCIRVVTAFLLVFAVLPWLVQWLGSEDRTLARFWSVAIQMALFAVTISLVLGSFQMCLPGAELAAYVALLGLVGYQRGIWRGFFRPGLWYEVLHRMLVLASEGFQRFSLPSQRRYLPVALQRLFLHPVVIFGLAIGLAGLSVCSHFIRFLRDDTYSRALSLQQLTLGQAWTPSGPAALLSPVAFLSSADGATVVRFAGPIFLGLLPVVVYAALRSTRVTAPAAILGSAVFTAGIAIHDSGEVGPGSLALIAWISAFAFRAVRAWDALCAVALALLLEPLPGLPAMIALLVFTCYSKLARFSQLTRLATPIAKPALGLACVVVIGVFASWQEGDGPQYNSVARAVMQVKRTLPRNTYLVVSPVQEVALIYGHGWHLELAEFVERFSPDLVRPAAFSFPFPVQETIVIIEKRPLRSRTMQSNLAGLGPRFDPLSAPYLLHSRRAAMEFRAAQIMAAYAASHQEVALVFEDKDIAVFHISRPPQLGD